MMPASTIIIMSFFSTSQRIRAGISISISLNIQDIDLN